MPLKNNKNELQTTKLVLQSKLSVIVDYVTLSLYFLGKWPFYFSLSSLNMQHFQRFVFVAYVKVVHVPIDKLHVIFPTWAVLLGGSSPNIKNYPWREWDKCVGDTIFLRSNLSSSLLNYWIQVSIVQFKQKSCELPD